MTTATVIGSGPNGLAAAITLAEAGVRTTVLERNERLGGGCSTAEVTLPGFRHDLGASAFPMGVVSPFFRGLKLRAPIPWVQPAAACAHPLDDGTAVMLENTVEDTAASLDAADKAAYTTMMRPLAEHWSDFAVDLLGPVQHVPRHPILLAKLGLRVLLPATQLARTKFAGARARALLAGMAAHAVMPLEAPTSSAVALVLMAAGNGGGWPVIAGGAGVLTDLLVEHLRGLGATVQGGREVTSLPGTDLTMADVTPRQLLRIAGDALPAAYRKQLAGYTYGGGAFKVDYALSEPIPWAASECGRSATVHLGGSLGEIADSERQFKSDRPFVLLVQPSLFDASRAPEGKHTAWAYCHVPQGSAADYLERLERQIERFAPGFREVVLARAVSPPAALESWNPNLVGGDLSGGEMTVKQLLFRPTPGLYRTPVKGLYLCGSSTPPGGGVHGMAGYHAATVALRGL